jgi:hypothetical protein
MSYIQIRKSEEDRVNTIKSDLAKKTENLKKLEQQSQRIKKYLKFPSVVPIDIKAVKETERANFIEEKAIQEESRYRQQVEQEKEAKRKIQLRNDGKKRLDIALNSPKKKVPARSIVVKPKEQGLKLVDSKVMDKKLVPADTSVDSQNVEAKIISSEAEVSDETALPMKMAERIRMPVPRAKPNQKVLAKKLLIHRTNR